jgi:MFS family permease
MSEAATVLRRSPRLAWLVWAVGALSFSYAFMQRVAPSVMVEDLMRDFAATGAVLGNLSAIYFYAYAGLQIPIGLALDAWGPRRMLTAAAVVAAVGSLLFSTGETLTTAYIGRLLIGIGCAVGFVGSLKIAVAWFPPNRFAFVSGMSMLMGMAGGIAGQAPMAAVVDVVGWRDALFGAGVLGLVLAAATWVIVRDHPATGDIAEIRRPARQVMADLKQVIVQRQIWLIALYGGVMSGPMLAYGALWGVPHLMTVYGLDRPTAAGSASLVLLGWAGGAPAAGWISDRLGRRRLPMAVAAVIALLSWVMLLYVPGLPLFLAWVLLFVVGASSAGMVITYALAREISPPRVSGAATGFNNMMTVGSGALMQPLIGWLLDRYWDGTEVDGVRAYSHGTYDAALVTLPICAAVAFVLVWFVRETYCRPRAE